MQTTTRWTMVAAVLMLAACGGSNDGTGPGNGGGGGVAGGGGGGGGATFDAQVAGDMVQTIQGGASFGSGTDGQGNTLHMIQLTKSGTTVGGIQFARQGAQGFSGGSYPIADAVNGNPGDGEVIAMFTDQSGGQMNAAFVASGGTLQVTGSSATRVSGTFSFDATGASLANPGATLVVTVSGSFTADKALGAITVTAAQVHAHR